jgi:hypothetical protein
MIGLSTGRRSKPTDIDKSTARPSGHLWWCQVLPQTRCLFGNGVRVALCSALQAVLKNAAESAGPGGRLSSNSDWRSRPCGTSRGSPERSDRDAERGWLRQAGLPASVGAARVRARAVGCSRGENSRRWRSCRDILPIHSSFPTRRAAARTRGSREGAASHTKMIRIT